MNAVFWNVPESREISSFLCVTFVWSGKCNSLTLLCFRQLVFLTIRNHHVNKWFLTVLWSNLLAIDRFFFSFILVVVYLDTVATVCLLSLDRPGLGFSIYRQHGCKQSIQLSFFFYLVWDLQNRNIINHFLKCYNKNLCSLWACVSRNVYLYFLLPNGI